MSLAFSKAALANFAAVFPESASQLESHGTWEGEVEYLVQDNADLKTSRSIQRIKTGVETLELHFADTEPTGLKSGDRLRVNGARVGTQVAAYGGSVQTPSTVLRGMCMPIGSQKTLVSW